MTDSLLVEALKRARLLAGVNLQRIEYLVDACKRRRLERGEHLLEPGMPNATLFLVLAGELRVYLQDRNLPPQATLGIGDCAGEMSALDGQPASALVLAASDGEVLEISQDLLWSLVDSSHAVARNLLGIVSGRVRESNKALAAMQDKSLDFVAADRADALTGLHTREWFDDAVSRSLMRCMRDVVPMSVVLADIDHFREFNERFGYLTGDALLRRMARRLSDGLRTGDFIARYGGEEFAILLPNTAGAAALPIAERLRELVAIGCGLATGEGVTLSCGVAATAEGDSAPLLLARAEAALKRAKDAGRNRVEVAG